MLFYLEFYYQLLELFFWAFREYHMIPFEITQAKQHQTGVQLLYADSKIVTDGGVRKRELRHVRTLFSDDTDTLILSEVQNVVNLPEEDLSSESRFNSFWKIDGDSLYLVSMEYGSPVQYVFNSQNIRKTATIEANDFYKDNVTKFA